MSQAMSLELLSNANSEISAKQRKLRQAQLYKKHLVGLTNNVGEFLQQIDRILREPPSIERGNKLAVLISALDVANDTALHYGLEIPFEEIRKRK